MPTPHPFDRIWPLLAPLSRASGPLRSGLERRRMLEAGVEMRETVIAGTRLNYYVRQGLPDQAPLLLVHGLGDSAMTWSPLFQLLPNHTLYALDLPGYGFSSPPYGRSYGTIGEMRDLLAAFACDIIGVSPVIVGNSMGGWLAVELGLHAPDVMRGVVLLNPGGALLDGEASYAEFRDLLGAQDLASARLVLRRMFGAVPRPLLYLSQSALQEVFQRPVVRDFVATLRDDEFLHEQRLHELRVPAALVWGEMDKFLPQGSFAFFRDHLPNAELHVLPGVGHLPHTERPRAVAQIIETFAARLAV